LHALSYQLEASVQERKRGLYLAGSPPFVLKDKFSPFQGRAAGCRLRRNAHDGVPTQILLRGSAEVSWPWAELGPGGWLNA